MRWLLVLFIGCHEYTYDSYVDRPAVVTSTDYRASYSYETCWDESNFFCTSATVPARYLVNVRAVAGACDSCRSTECSFQGGDGSWVERIYRQGRWAKVVLRTRQVWGPSGILARTECVKVWQYRSN